MKEVWPMRFTTPAIRDDVLVSSIRLLDIPGGCVAESEPFRVSRAGQASSAAFLAGRFCFVTLELWRAIVLAFGEDLPLVECLCAQVECPCIAFVSFTLIFRRTQAWQPELRGIPTIFVWLFVYLRNFLDYMDNP